MNKKTNEENLAKFKIKTTFAKKLSILIDEKQIKQVDLAKAIGVSESTISTWLSLKNSKLPKMDTVEKIANYFNCQSSELLTEENSTTFSSSKPSALQQEIINIVLSMSDEDAHEFRFVLEMFLKSKGIL